MPDPHSLLTRRLYGLPVAVIDFETTGLDPWSCHPVQVAIVTCELGRTPPRIAHRRLIACPVPIPDAAARVHGITADRLVGAPGWERVGLDVAAAIRGRVVVAFNVPYDLPILLRQLGAAGRQAPAPPWLDPLVWSRRLGKGPHRLAAVCDRYRLRLDGAHDAGADALATARILPRLAADLVAAGALERGAPLSDVWAAQSRWALDREANHRRQPWRRLLDHVHALEAQCSLTI